MTMRPAWLENWLIRNTPSCKEVIRSLSDSLDRPIPLHHRIGVRLHFLICTWCLRYQKQIALIRSRIRRAEPESSDARPSDDARERLKHLTRQNRN